MPAPNKYNINTGIQGDGRHFVSSLKSSMCRSFPHEKRETGAFQKFKTPGPGQYRMPSEFGHYEAAKKQGQLEPLK